MCKAIAFFPLSLKWLGTRLILHSSLSAWCLEWKNLSFYCESTSLNNAIRVKFHLFLVFDYTCPYWKLIYVVYCTLRISIRRYCRHSGSVAVTGVSEGGESHVCIEVLTSSLWSESSQGDSLGTRLFKSISYGVLISIMHMWYAMYIVTYIRMYVSMYIFFSWKATREKVL